MAQEWKEGGLEEAEEGEEGEQLGYRIVYENERELVEYEAHPDKSQLHNNNNQQK